ncbi:MAG: hypothetical protein NT154_08225 [Verrucomicrobia bacterium]|nr:hypothetical protein [Verrucomicrobiota bacterium]
MAESAVSGEFRNWADLWEDYRLGHRVRAYVIEGRNTGSEPWRSNATPPNT